MHTPRRNGFTLIELLVVMVIIGILATIGIGNFGTARMKARDVKRKGDLTAIAKALEAYANDHRAYPPSSSGSLSCVPPATCGWGEPFADDKGTLYLAQIPVDSSADRLYYYDSSGVSFTLYARLENSEDPAAVDIPGTDCGGGELCNFKVTSSNIN